MKEVAKSVPEYFVPIPKDVWAYLMSFLSHQDAINFVAAFKDWAPIRDVFGVKYFEENPEKKDLYCISKFSKIREYCRYLATKPREVHRPILVFILEKLSPGFFDRKLIEDAEQDVDPVLKDIINELITESWKPLRSQDFDLRYQELIHDLELIVNPKADLVAFDLPRAVSRRETRSCSYITVEATLSLLGSIAIIMGAIFWSSGSAPLAGKIMVGVGLPSHVAGSLMCANMCADDALEIAAGRLAKKCWASFFSSSAQAERIPLLMNESRENKMERGELASVQPCPAGP